MTSGDRRLTTRFIPSGVSSVVTVRSRSATDRFSGEDTLAERDGPDDRDRRDTRSELGFFSGLAATGFFSALDFFSALGATGFFSITFRSAIFFSASLLVATFGSASLLVAIFLETDFLAAVFFSAVFVSAVFSAVFAAAAFFSGVFSIVTVFSGLRELIFFFRVFSGDVLVDFFLSFEVLRLGERLNRLLLFIPCLPERVGGHHRARTRPAAAADRATSRS
ncbi:hypothetical protein [Pseudonocardia sp. TRM90224]|uniref:hypothetical protein n=1 Tax=Pseudonocardia sp. TRM90224 TaxID=2812678 RepID=UPI001E555247|nr:hypothetical protein [Pseudonocardia sp. TRM90224]